MPETPIRLPLKRGAPDEEGGDEIIDAQADAQTPSPQGGG